LHDDGRAETPQDVLLFGGKGDAARAVVLRDVYCVVEIVRQSLLVIREPSEAVLPLLKLAAFALTARALDQFAVCDAGRSRGGGSGWLC
jgi:hypothetical protein